MKLAVVVLSKSGLALAREIRSARVAETSIFGPSCVVGNCHTPGPRASSEQPAASILAGTFATGEPGVHGWRGPLRLVLPAIWQAFDGIVPIMAVGVVVRLVGPLLTDKRADPAVVVVDDTARFAISLLGGHGAGGNALARELAELLGAQPVITTASDAHGLPAADLIGRALGWKIERRENLTRVAAAIVRREPVAVWQDAASPHWWQPFGGWPEHLTRLDTWDEWNAGDFSALLAISDHALPAGCLDDPRVVVYRPPSLIAGIGCRRGVELEALEAFVARVFADHALALGSLAAVATVTLKADEPALVAFAQKLAIPLVTFTPDALSAQPGVRNPSERVRAKIGIGAVAEPAALRAAGSETLLVEKQKGPGMTLALARKKQA